MNSLLDLLNSSYPTQPHSLVVNYGRCASGILSPSRTQSGYLPYKACQVGLFYPGKKTGIKLPEMELESTLQEGVFFFFLGGTVLKAT